MKDKRQEYFGKMQQLRNYCGEVNDCLVCECSSICEYMSHVIGRIPEHWDSDDIRCAVNMLLLEDQRRLLHLE